MDSDKCKKCEFRKESRDRDGFSFWGCYHYPHHGMWVGMVKVCPKAGNVQPEPIDCINRLTDDRPRELFEGSWDENDMYQSPIKICLREVNAKIENQIESQIYEATTEVGVSVDKEELIKALRYDRGQYDAGYKDGYDAGYQKAVADLRNSVDERFHRLVRDILSESEDQTDGTHTGND